ncbi:acetylornithine aminotransferase [Blastocladiella emersonii ATCC 22665]|nr:acetylornithine aminotransferase [Blastocladiella emersonii ATCC 22665]
MASTARTALALTRAAAFASAAAGRVPAARRVALPATALARRTLSTSATGAPTSDEHLIPLYGRPADVVLTHGRGALLYDTRGREYVDFTAGIAVCSLGHADAQIAEVLYDQAKKLVHVSNLYRNEWAEKLAEQIVQSARREYLMGEDPQMAAAGPGKKELELSHVFFCNSGTEANEAALKFARAHYPDPAKHKVLTFHNAFHGRSMGALSATPNPKYQKPFLPLVPGFESVPFNDLAAARAALSHGGFCAILVEPLQGEGGIRPSDPSFLPGLRALADEHDCLLMFDEIQCGLARTGRVWAHHWTPVTPDVLTAAKPLGNGVPIGAVVTNAKVSTSLAPASHGTTFGGNPLACRVGSHIMGRLTDPALLAHVKAMGDRVVAKLGELQHERPDVVVAVRGRGLIAGLELNHAAVPDAGKKVVDACRADGLLICTAGKEGNVMRIVPPLVTPVGVLDRGLEVLVKAVKALK